MNVGISTFPNFGECNYQSEQGGRKYRMYKMNRYGIMQMLNKESTYVRYKTQQYIEALKTLGLGGEGNFSLAKYIDKQGKERPYSPILGNAIISQNKVE